MQSDSLTKHLRSWLPCTALDGASSGAGTSELILFQEPLSHSKDSLARAINYLLVSLTVPRSGRPVAAVIVEVQAPGDSAFSAYPAEADAVTRCQTLALLHSLPWATRTDHVTPVA